MARMVPPAVLTTFVTLFVSFLTRDVLSETNYDRTATLRIYSSILDYSILADVYKTYLSSARDFSMPFKFTSTIGRGVNITGILLNTAGFIADGASADGITIPPFAGTETILTTSPAILIVFRNFSISASPYVIASSAGYSLASETVSYKIYPYSGPQTNLTDLPDEISPFSYPTGPATQYKFAFNASAGVPRCAIIAIDGYPNFPLVVTAFNQSNGYVTCSTPYSGDVAIFKNSSEASSPNSDSSPPSTGESSTPPSSPPPPPSGGQKWYNKWWVIFLIVLGSIGILICLLLALCLVFLFGGGRPRQRGGEDGAEAPAELRTTAMPVDEGFEK